MRPSWVLALLLTAAGPAYAQQQNHETVAESAFAGDNYKAAREHFSAALEQTTDPQQQLQLRRKIAALYVFEGELNDAREAYQELIDWQAATRQPADAHEYYALAGIGALQHKKSEVLKHTVAASKVQPVTPYAPMFHAIVWAHVGEIDRVLQARADMDAAAEAAPDDSIAQQAAALTRTIYATKIREWELARREMAGISIPSMKAFATAFLANGLRREGKRGEAQALDKQVRAFRELSIYSALAHRLIRP